jgi:hypothetical protein
VSAKDAPYFFAVWIGLFAAWVGLSLRFDSDGPHSIQGAL